MSRLFNRFSATHILHWLRQDSGSTRVYSILHRLLGIVYLVALVPLFFEIKGILGEEGLMPAKNLLHLAYADIGIPRAIIQFPSLFHLYPADVTLYIILAIGCIGALMMITGFRVFWGALLAWISFLSITTIGGDFFIIIIDLFLAETGFLALFTCFFLQYYKAIPNAVDFAFRLLNFRLWFCMGVNKFYLPMEVWTDFTFFDYFFHAQPMPTPAAWCFERFPGWMDKVAIAGLFIGEVIVPFFVFGGKGFRWLAFITFVLISVFIQLTGNYGYFNVLSVVLALAILKDSDLPFRKRIAVVQEKVLSLRIPAVVTILLAINISYQALYSITVFDSTPYSYQNHYNYTFNNWHPENKVADKAMEVLRLPGYWRMVNPYGVFKGIPKYHVELRFSGSMDNLNWKPYTFKYLPSSNTGYLGFYAPYYPRLDHLMFYEGINEQAYRHNPLNPYYTERDGWICRFREALFEQHKPVTRLLRNDPFASSAPPEYLKVELYQLTFSDDTKYGYWNGKPLDIVRYYHQYDSVANCKPILTNEEAMFGILGD